MQCKQSTHVHDFGGKYLSIFNYHESFSFIISKTNNISFTLKRIPYSSDIDRSVTGRVWYLVVSTPDLCTLTYFKVYIVIYVTVCMI